MLCRKANRADDPTSSFGFNLVKAQLPIKIFRAVRDEVIDVPELFAILSTVDQPVHADDTQVIFGPENAYHFVVDLDRFASREQSVPFERIVPGEFVVKIDDKLATRRRCSDRFGTRKVCGRNCEVSVRRNPAHAFGKRPSDGPAFEQYGFDAFRPKKPKSFDDLFLLSCAIYRAPAVFVKDLIFGLIRIVLHWFGTKVTRFASKQKGKGGKMPPI